MINNVLLTYITIGIGFTTTLIYFNANTFYRTNKICYADVSTQTNIQSTQQKSTQTSNPNAATHKYQSCATQTPVEWKSTSSNQKLPSSRNDGWYDILQNIIKE